MLTSWVVGADGSGFSAEHLPYGVFAEAGAATGAGAGGLPRVGVRIGDHVLDLARLAQERVVDGPFDQPSLNPFMAEGPARWRLVRETPCYRLLSGRRIEDELPGLVDAALMAVAA